MSDPGGILFFGQVFPLAHEAFERFVLEKLGCSWSQWFQNEQWIVPIRHAAANYLKPLKSGETCSIEIDIKQITRSSFSMGYQFFQPQLCCEATTVHVFCDRSSEAKIPIPEEILSALQKFFL